MASNKQSDTERTGPSEGFAKALAFLIVGLYVYRRWF